MVFTHGLGREGLIIIVGPAHARPSLWRHSHIDDEECKGNYELLVGRHAKFFQFCRLVKQAEERGLPGHKPNFSREVCSAR